MGDSRVKNIILVFIVLLVGATLLTPFADEIAGVGSNVTGAAATVTDLLPLFFALILLGIAVKYIK